MAVSYADPAILQRVKLCLKKRAYKTEDRAWEVCKKMWKKHGDLMGPFKCGHCPNWHIGHPQNPYLQWELWDRAQQW
jgi:hypothetical protein